MVVAIVVDVEPALDFALEPHAPRSDAATMVAPLTMVNDRRSNIQCAFRVADPAGTLLAEQNQWRVAR